MGATSMLAFLRAAGLAAALAMPLAGGGCMTCKLIGSMDAHGPAPERVVALEAISVTGTDPALAIVHVRARLGDGARWGYVAEPDAPVRVEGARGLPLPVGGAAALRLPQGHEGGVRAGEAYVPAARGDGAAHALSKEEAAGAIFVEPAGEDGDGPASVYVYFPPPGGRRPANGVYPLGDPARRIVLPAPARPGASLAAGTKEVGRVVLLSALVPAALALDVAGTALAVGTAPVWVPLVLVALKNGRWC